MQNPWPAIKEVVMLELALRGSRTYWIWMIFLLGLIGAGLAFYIWQLEFGLGITGMSRDVSWGFYIANFTFLVGVAAGGVMVVLPYYLHDYKAFGKVVILGEFLAIAAVTMCMLFIVVDLGQPGRVLNVLLHPTPNSVLFWDAMVLNGYLFLNLIIGWNVLEAERNGIHYQKWLKPLIYISIPWAVSIHTVTAYLYCGMPGRGFWLTAILAPRFLASAFAAGPALLILLCLFIRKTTNFDPGKQQIQSLAKIVTYAICLNVFFLLCEVFVAFYSNIPEHMDHLKYLYAGLHGHNALVPWMWTSVALMGVSIILLVIPATRQNESVLAFTCVILFIGTWIDKGLGMISGGFVPSPLHHVNEYAPSFPEIMITLGVYGVGALALTILYKIAVTVKEEVAA
jgi:Ni/Fe-hydrogenase subunit HybB-like protein